MKLISGFKILNKHKVQVFLMIILSGLLFSLFGSVLNSNQRQEKAKKEFDKTYGTVKLYKTGENLSAVDLDNYTDKSGKKGLENMCQFKQKLCQEKEFKFTTIGSQMLNIYNKKIPKKFLYSYDSENPDATTVSSCITKHDKNTIYSVKSLQITDKFFEIFNISIAEGHRFSKDDFIYNDKNTIPVILGNDYKKYFKIGNTFDAEYMGTKRHYIVIGFLRDKSFFYDSSSCEMSSCNTYMIIPAITPATKTYFAKEIALDHTNGIISSKIGAKKTANIFEKHKKETGLTNYQIYVATDNKDDENILETYSSMTKEVANQFKIILAALTLLAFTINVSVFLNMLRENDANFCIERLCGARQVDIDFEAFVPVFVVLLNGNLLGFLILITFNELTISYLYVQILIGFILIATCTIVHFYMKKLHLHHYIGGKE